MSGESHGSKKRKTVKIANRRRCESKEDRTCRINFIDHNHKLCMFLSVELLCSFSLWQMTFKKSPKGNPSVSRSNQKTRRMKVQRKCSRSFQVWEVWNCMPKWKYSTVSVIARPESIWNQRFFLFDVVQLCRNLRLKPTKRFLFDRKSKVIGIRFDNCGHHKIFTRHL